MDRRKLHERIAESLEPKPTHKGRVGELSNTGAWACFQHRIGEVQMENQGKHFSVGRFEQSWEAFNPDTDESANALLLEAMNDKWAAIFRNPRTKLWHVGFFEVVINADRKVAIVDAYCKWKGLADEG